MNYDAKLAKFIVASGLIDDIVVVDVGCSGGIDPNLRQLEPMLVAVGIDPLANEIARLRSLEQNPKVSYINTFVISDRSYKARTGNHEANWFYRSSAVAALDPGADTVGKLIKDAQS